LFLFVNVVDAHQRAGEGGYFPERDEERFMDLAFGVNEDTTEEEDEAAKGQNCSSYELDVGSLHSDKIEIECKYAHIFSGFANFFPKCFPTRYHA